MEYLPAIIILGYIAWATSRPKRKVNVPLTNEERKLYWSLKAGEPAEEEDLRRVIRGQAVIEDVLYREKPTGALGRLAHDRRHAERKYREAELRLVKTPREPVTLNARRSRNRSPGRA